MIINNTNLELFKADVTKALQDVAKKYNVEIKCNGATYDMDSFSMPLKVKNLSASGLDTETQRAIDNLPWFKDIFRKEFADGRHTYRVVGYEFGKSYPIKCVRDDGREFSYKTGIVNDMKFF